jgi:hypothetical protein
LSAEVVKRKEREERTYQLIEEGDDLGNDKGESGHAEDKGEPDDPVGLGRVLEMVRSSEGSDEAKLGGEMDVDDGTGKKSGDGDWEGETKQDCQ